MVSVWFPNDSNSVLVAALKHSPSKRKSLSKPLRHEELIEHSKYTSCINLRLIRTFYLEISFSFCVLTRVICDLKLCLISRCYL